jgi:hypothetical protein
MRRTRLLSALIPALLASLLLAGCSAGVEDGGGFPSEPGIGEQPSDGDGGSESGRDVVVTGSIIITAEDPIAAAGEAARIVGAVGGRVDGRTEYAPTNGDKGSATLTLRIPAAQVDAVIDDLKALGRADEVSISSYDVTVESVDLQAQIDAKRASIERINTFLASAPDIDQLIALETQLTIRQGELDSLESRQRLLQDQIAMSTITLYLRSEAEAPAVVPGDFWSGLQAGWGALVAFGAGLLVGLGVMLPWLIVAGIITAVVILLVRRHRRRRAAAYAAQQPPPPPKMPTS